MMIKAKTTDIPAYDVQSVREQFPVLKREIYGNKPLIYLDNAASSQKPLSVIKCIADYYSYEHANIHRGVHYLSEKATEKYEAAREKTARFINAEKNHEVIFTSGTTESVNLVASAFDRAFIREGDEIIVSHMEHHSNLVPWQMLCERRGAVLKVVPVSDSGDFIFEEFEKLLGEKTALVAVSHVSNTLGTINPVKRITKKAHEVGAKVLIDGAQATPHLKVDVRDLDCDFYAFSGHKMYGPTGIGILYGKESLLDAMPPYKGGGEMIKTVTLEKTTYNDLPHKFEAGTPHIAGGIGLGAAIDFLDVELEKGAAQHEDELLQYGSDRLKNEFEQVRFIGKSKHKTGVVSFLLGDIHPYDVGVLLDKQGVAVRTGHHCTEPLMQHYGIPGTVRASLGMYNTKGDIDALITALKRAEKMLM